MVCKRARLGSVSRPPAAHGSAVEDAGDPETAIELYFAANEPGEALAVVSRSGELVTDNCRFDSLRSWLDRLAPNAASDDPWVLFLAGQLALREGDPSKALDALTRAEASFRARGDRWGVYHALSAIEAIWFWKGDFEQAATYCEAALEAATTAEQRVHTLVSLGSARSYVCRWSEAEALWRRGRGELRLRRAAGNWLVSQPCGQTAGTCADDSWRPTRGCA